MNYKGMSKAGSLLSVMIYTDPLRDAQTTPPAGTCARCGYELYPYEGEICEKCKEEIKDE